MRLYHPGCLPALLLLGLFNLLAACSPTQEIPESIPVEITVEGERRALMAPVGSTVEEAISLAGIQLGRLDRVEPPLSTVLVAGADLRVIRVEEAFRVEEVVLPFEARVVHSETLVEGQEHWLQLGENGLQEITIRYLYEDGVEVSRNVVKSEVIREPLPQIKMVGVQRPFAPLEIPGKLAYILDGEAWMMETTTGDRRQLVGSGDLDGRVFSLSPDGEWLLFTRHSDEEGTINHLWVAQVSGADRLEIDLQVENVVHFAGWKPDMPTTVAYSTVETRAAPPGWQANNDLALITFSPTGGLRELPALLETNMGGVYGWWGMSFSWSPDGLQLAYTRPDGAGLVDLEDGELLPILTISPFQTFSDWAWSPGIAWSPDGNALYVVDHPEPADGQVFDLVAVSLAGSRPVSIATQAGMFAYPAPSPIHAQPSGEQAHRLAYLQAIYPAQSESSRYRLMVVDRDGSNRKTLFPEESPGLEPQKVVWSPEALADGRDFVLAFLYQNNIWLIDAESGETWQITGDNRVSRLDWK